MLLRINMKTSRKMHGVCSIRACNTVIHIKIIYLIMYIIYVFPICQCARAFTFHIRTSTIGRELTPVSALKNENVCGDPRSENNLLTSRMDKLVDRVVKIFSSHLSDVIITTRSWYRRNSCCAVAVCCIGTPRSYTL